MGKTTLARILGTAFKADDIQEIDAASNSGVERLRELVQSMQFRPLTGGSRLLIMDECHALSKQAWQPLLKTLEEPPPFLYVVLCTTEASKVPDTIRSRCQEYVLREIPPSVLEGVLDDLPETKNLASSIKGALIAYAGGSLRRMLTGAEKVYRLTDLEQAKSALRRLEASEGPVIDLARMIASGRFSWERAQPMFSVLAEESADCEGARRQIQGYLTKAVLGAKGDDAVGRLVQALDAFSRPVQTVGDLIVSFFIAKGGD